MVTAVSRPDPAASRARGYSHLSPAIHPAWPPERASVRRGTPARRSPPGGTRRSAQGAELLAVRLLETDKKIRETSRSHAGFFSVTAGDVSLHGK